jgi:hypothetical protein
MKLSAASVEMTASLDSVDGGQRRVRRKKSKKMRVRARLPGHTHQPRWLE